MSRRATPPKHLPLWILLAAALVVGILTVSQYGESWDEADIYRYSEYAIGAYAHIFHPVDLQPFDTNLNLYGPGYYMAVNLIARGLVALIPGWSSVDAWHFLYFSTFLGCALALYLLSLRWMSSLGAFGVTLLFISQPLLWGHAFINPKDIPFMAFFTATIYAGLRMVDELASSRRLKAVVIAAGFLLGITSAFRVLGPLAGVIVLGYAGCVLGRRAFGPGLAYVAIAATTAYLSWPYLWSAPIGRYLASIRTMAQFPFTSSILFADHLYKANQLPRIYFPFLLGIQLTEPALILMLAGMALSVMLALRRQISGPLVLLLAWFVAPAAIIIGTGSPLYDNARQLYFLLPPLFIIAGLVFDKLFSLLRNPWARSAILAAAALPGILLTARLFPYEYIYYNVLEGGTGGAYRHFEMDYWGVSFKEITAHLNAVAPQAASVLVYGPEPVVEHYARADIQVGIPNGDALAHYDYVILVTRSNVDERRCKDSDTIFSVGRRGAVFSLLKSIPPGSACN